MKDACDVTYRVKHIIYSPMELRLGRFSICYRLIKCKRFSSIKANWCCNWVISLAKRYISSKSISSVVVNLLIVVSCLVDRGNGCRALASTIKNGHVLPLRCRNSVSRHLFIILCQCI